MKPRALTWDLAGEDLEAIVHPGDHLAKDWRTVASACLAYSAEVGRHEALTMWETRPPILHGWECWAPPGETGDGIYAIRDDCAEEIPGWVAVGEHCCGYGDHATDAVCLGMDEWDAAGIETACRTAAPDVKLIAPGDGWPWLSRIIHPATIVVLC